MDMEQTIKFAFHETNAQSLLRYMDENCEIWLGRRSEGGGGKLIEGVRGECVFRLKIGGYYESI